MLSAPPRFVVGIDKVISWRARAQGGVLMSENVGGVPEPQNRGSFVRAPREFYGGLVMVAVALFALWASCDLPGMRGFAFGPGTAPRIFAVVLGVLGITVAATGVLTKGPGIDRFYWRGPFFVTLSVVLFAWLVRPLGLVIATFLSILAAAGATPEARLFETLIWAAALTAFCVLLFPITLNLPMQLWPNSWDLAAILKGLSSIR